MRIQCAVFAIFFFLLSVSTAFATVGSDTMIGYWKLDELSIGGSSSVIDSSGESKHGTPANSPTISTQVPFTLFPDPRSYQFDGTNYISTSLSAPASATISLWARPTSVADWRSPAGWKNDPAVTNNGYAVIDMGNAQKWRAVFRPYNGVAEATVTAGSTFSTNTWYHLAMTYSLSGSTWTVKLYVNGVSQGSTTWTGVPVNGVGSFNIGKAGDFNDNFFIGQIDDVRVYNRALTDTELADLATGSHTNATFTGSTSSDFENTGNWSPAVIPDPYTIIHTAANKTLTLSSAESIAGLDIVSSSFFNLAGFNLTMNDLSATSGLATSSGTLISKNSESLNFTFPATGTVLYTTPTNATGLTAGNNYANLIFNDGMNAYWKLDETSAGSSVTDSSGYGNSGTPAGASGSNNKPQPSIDIPSTFFANDRSLSFDGTDDTVSFSPLPITYPFTFSAWIKPTSIENTQGVNTRLIGPVNSVASNNFYSVALGNGNTGTGCTTGTNRLLLWDGNCWNGLSGDNTISTGAWQHIAITVNGSLSATGYINGIAQNSVTVLPSTWNYASLALGTNYLGFGNLFSGAVDDVRFYNRVLTASEIARLARGDEPATTLATATLNHALSVSGNLVLNSGTLDVSASNYGINVAGNLENNGGVFTARSGTVTLSGSNQRITSGMSFFNLNKTISTSDTLTFGKDTISTTSGTLTLLGAPSNLLSLRSSTTGTAFKLDPQSTRSIDYVNVQDSNNINSTAIAYSGNDTYGSNLTNWITSAPTPTPTATPTSSASSSTGSSSSSSSGDVHAPVCSVLPLAGVPDIFQIDRTPVSATVYFTPVSGADRYVVRYGLTSAADMYATTMAGTSVGVQSITIGSLFPEKYYFSVRAGRGCATGNWSAVSSATTKKLMGAFSPVLFPVATYENPTPVVSPMPTLRPLATVRVTPSPTARPDISSPHTSLYIWTIFLIGVGIVLTIGVFILFATHFLY